MNGRMAGWNDLFVAMRDEPTDIQEKNHTAIGPTRPFPTMGKPNGQQSSKSNQLTERQLWGGGILPKEQSGWETPLASLQYTAACCVASASPTWEYSSVQGKMENVRCAAHYSPNCGQIAPGKEEKGGERNRGKKGVRKGSKGK